MRAGAPHRDFGLREQLPRFENYQNVKMWESRKSSSTPISTFDFTRFAHRTFFRA